jgi:hypothetical protein
MTDEASTLLHHQALEHFCCHKLQIALFRSVMEKSLILLCAIAIHDLNLVKNVTST